MLNFMGNFFISLAITPVMYICDGVACEFNVYLLFAQCMCMCLFYQCKQKSHEISTIQFEKKIGLWILYIDWALYYVYCCVERRKKVVERIELFILNYYCKISITKIFVIHISITVKISGTRILRYYDILRYIMYYPRRGYGYAYSRNAATRIFSLEYRSLFIFIK